MSDDSQVVRDRCSSCGAEPGEYHDQMCRVSDPALLHTASPMSDECRFDKYGFCDTHGGGNPAAALCTHAAAALQAKVDFLRAELDKADQLKRGYYNEALSGWQKFRAAEARVRELEGQYELANATIETMVGKLAYAEQGWGRAEQAVGRMREWDRTWYPILAGRLIALQQSGEQVAADRWMGLILELRAALSSQEPQEEQ